MTLAGRTRKEEVEDSINKKPVEIEVVVMASVALTNQSEHASLETTLFPNFLVREFYELVD